MHAFRIEKFAVKCRCCSALVASSRPAYTFDAAAGAHGAEDRPSAGRCPPPPEKSGLALKAKKHFMQLRDKVALEAAAFASGARRLFATAPSTDFAVVNS